MDSAARATPRLLRYLTALVGIGSITVATAAGAGEATIELYESTREGPWGEPLTQFHAALDNHPNATGDFPFGGPNISSRYVRRQDGGGEIDGWSWSIAVASDISLENSDKQTDLANQSDLFYVGGIITLNAPESLLNSTGHLTVSDDWEMCTFRWLLNGFNYTDRLRSDDGTCTSVLTEQCISYLKEAAYDNHHQGSVCSCPMLDDVGPCEDLGERSAVLGHSCTAQRYNASDFREWEDGKLDVHLFGDKQPHDFGDTANYDDIGSLAWPIITTFKNRTGAEEFSNARSFMSCVRAMDAVDGSDAPEFESRASGLGVTWARIGIVLALCILTL
ncbi:hypothetical protein F5B22DRAFT_615953 [Xylaria bambusicola]|uniref:uncharacterized protein n=1 Tax=Xylaria bambusicola TaxID=326684 RepID=UPI002008656F|nr:uncharacterized protein F5B22DRAFT_615953 [Xylaria bambusicola]KAI0509756.1 hypothetical protein F5B22DRAFT_615953 [Xylaria bambusicola]